jgi:RNA polymerase sigma-70 factor (ECF subfamily)
MPSRGEPGTDERRRVVYCVVPRDLVRKVHEPLRRHFQDEPDVEIVVERRAGDRRAAPERRAAAAAEHPDELRRIRNAEGRRVGDRRAAVIGVDPGELPRRVRPHAARLVFIERVEPTAEHTEDLDTARLVTRFQGGDRDAFSALYLRYFERVYAYLKIALGDSHEAEDTAQQVFLKVLEALPRYERRKQPFRAWLFVVVRNHALTQLRTRDRAEPLEPADIDARRDTAREPDLGALRWVTDRELVVFVERLPRAQQQILMLRYMLDLSSIEVARILDMTPDQVRSSQRRALRFLEARLTAIGREPEERERTRMRRWRKQAVVLRHRRFALMR